MKTININEIAMKLSNIAISAHRENRLSFGKVYEAKKSGFSFSFELAEGVFNRNKNRLFVSPVDFPLFNATEWSVLMSEERQQYFKVFNMANQILAAYEF